MSVAGMEEENTAINVNNMFVWCKENIYAEMQN